MRPSNSSPYFLTSSRLGFRCWTEDDLPLALSLWGCTRVTRLIGGPFSEQQIKERLQREISTFDAHGFQYWPIFSLATHEFTGCAGVRPYGSSDDILELGVHLRPEYWGQGLAEEAARAVISFAFSKTAASALFAGHHPTNHNSQRLLEKLGFHFTHTELYPPTGLMHPSYLLARPERA